VVPSTPPSPLWLLVPLGMVGAALRWMAARRRSATPPAPWQTPASRRVGIVTAQARLSLRPAHHDIQGVVLDAARDAPIANAKIALITNHEERVVFTDAAGRFGFDALSSGQYVLHVSAAGFAPERASPSVPHRGEWAGMRVGLENLRERAVRAYRPIAEAVLPQPRNFERLTLRETYREASQAGHASDALEALTARVEHAAYAPVAPTESEVDDITADGSQLLAELDARGDESETSAGAGPKRGP
jgi:hypothetical protein